MELYNKEFVYFDWDNRLEGKKGFVAQNIAALKNQVNNSPNTMVTLSGSGDDACPFTYYVDDEITCDYQFAYYDPYYEFRRAYLEGKQIQFKDYNDNWLDVEGEPLFCSNEYRIKPKMWYVVLDEYGLFRTNSKEDEHVMFAGSEEECDRWISEHDKFNPVMIAYYLQNKPVQKFSDDLKIYVDVTNPDWNPIEDYIIKSEDTEQESEDGCEGCNRLCTHRNGIRCKSYCIKVEYVPFDTVEELIDAWDSKYPQNKNRPEGTMPLIWVKLRESNDISLITDFYFDCGEVALSNTQVSLEELWKYYTFLDSSIIGKVKEE